jgi:hypothetical protein
MRALAEKSKATEKAGAQTIDHYQMQEGRAMSRRRQGKVRNPRINAALPPIDELLNYWIDISKRPTLTLEDYALFFERAKATMAYFEEVYDVSRDKFFSGHSNNPV